MKLPDNNPKTQYGVSKPGLSAVSPYALMQLGLVMENGASKYGPFNYRQTAVSASVYYNAAMRHLMSWWDGEGIDPESGLPHLAHVMACCAILLDTQRLGTQKDDRPVIPGAAGVFIREHATKMKGDENVKQEPATTEPVNDEGHGYSRLGHAEGAPTPPYAEQPWKKAWKENR